MPYIIYKAVQGPIRLLRALFIRALPYKALEGLGRLMQINAVPSCWTDARKLPKAGSTRPGETIRLSQFRGSMWFGAAPATVRFALARQRPAGQLTFIPRACSSMRSRSAASSAARAACKADIGVPLLGWSPSLPAPANQALPRAVVLPDALCRPELGVLLLGCRLLLTALLAGSLPFLPL